MKPEEVTLMMGEMRSDIKSILKQVDRIASWQEAHEREDAERDRVLNERIDGLKDYGKAISIVSGFIGAGLGWAINKIG